MRSCGRERKPEGRGACGGSQPPPRRCSLRARTSVYPDLARTSSFHSSTCVTRERAAAPAAASVLPLGSTNLRLHPTRTGLVIGALAKGDNPLGRGDDRNQFVGST